MNKLMLCLKCDELKTRDEMQYNQASKPDICKECAAEIKAGRRVEHRRHQKETLNERNECQKYERDAKRKAIGDALTNNVKQARKPKVKDSMFQAIEEFRDAREIYRLINGEL